MLILAIVAGLGLILYVLHRNPEQVVTAEPVPVKEESVSVATTAVVNPHWEALLSEFEATMLKWLEETHTPGFAVAVVQDTVVLYLKGWGVKATGTQDSIDVNTVFRLASVSKCFAPVLTGLLVEDSLLDWNDPVIRHAPEFALHSEQHTQAVTLRHILSHTSGLPYHTYTNLVEEGHDLKTLLSRLREVDLVSKPGEVYSYQNVAYSAIAEVVESVTGKNYNELMTERIFRPLRMENASLTYEDFMANTNTAKPHRLGRKGWRVVPLHNTYYNVAPAGGINASISDMARWMIALVGSRQNLIAPETLDEIFKPVVKAKAKNRNFRRWIAPFKSYYALGWRVLGFKNDTLLYHGGYVNGFRSEIALFRENRIGICVLSNAPGRLINNSIPWFFNLYFQRRDSIEHWQKNQEVIFATQASHEKKSG